MSGGRTVWLTGLSGSGKSTLARALEKALVERGRPVSVLDGDVLRTGLCSDLGFSPQDRAENIRRVGEVSKLLTDAGVIVIAACISPYAAGRARAREAVGADRFLLVYVAASVEVCRERDPKGLYAKADRGEIPEFTGVSAPYEVPESPDLAIDTSAVSVEDSLARLLEAIG